MDIDTFLKKFGREPKEFVLEQFRRQSAYVLLGEHPLGKISHELVTAVIHHLPEKHAVYLDISSSWQSSIDAFLNGEETALDHLSNEKRTLINREGVIPSPLDDEYVALLKAARERKILVIAIGINPEITLEGDLWPFQKKCVDDYVAKKDEHMARCIGEAPGLVYTTNWHIARHAPHSLASLLRNKEKKCYAIAIESNALVNSSETAGFTAGIHNHLNGKPIAFHLGSRELRDEMDKISMNWNNRGDTPIYPTVYNSFNGLIYYPNP